MHPNSVPQRAETLQILRLMDKNQPILMLGGDDFGAGTRWTLSGQEIQPAIVRFLMDSGFIDDAGKTELGATKLELTEKGYQFRQDGISWWSKLNFWQKLKITLFG